MSKLKAQYIGERIIGDDKISHCFLFEGKEIYFSKVKYCWLGYFYEILKEKKGGGFGMHIRPENLGEGPMTEKQRELWETKAAQARQFARNKRQAASIRKNPKVLRVARDLKPLMKSLTWSGKRELLDFIFDELDREVREETARDHSTAVAKIRKRMTQLARETAKEKKL